MDILVSDYIIEDEEQGILTEAYYCTKLGQVKGILLIKNDSMKFDAICCQENEYLVIIPLYNFF